MIRIGRVVRHLPILALFLLASSCNGFFVSESSLQSVTVSPTAVILKAAASAGTTGDSYTLSSTATTVGNTTTTDTPTATWTSSDNTVATVAAGVVTAVGTTGGATATITATDGPASGTSTVYLYTGAIPTTISLTGSTGTLSPGTYQLHAFLGTSTTEVTDFVSWSSSDTTIATVSTTGLVTVLSSAAAGATATITAAANIGASGSAAPTSLTVTATYTVI